MLLQTPRRLMQSLLRPVIRRPIRTRASDRRRKPWLEALEDRFLLATNTWNITTGGSWQTANNWSLGHSPTTGEDVVIPDLAGTQTITFAAGSDTSSILSLTTSENVALSSGTLLVTGPLQSLGGQVSLQGASLGNATIAAGTTLVMTAAGGALTSVTVNGDLDLTQEQNANVVVFGGLVLNGTMYLGNSAGTTYGRVYFGNSGSAAGSLTGNATVVFGAWNLGGNYIRNDSNLAGAPGTLTIGSGVTMNGKNGSIYCNFGNGSLVNQGTINVANAAGTFIVGGNGTSAFSNQQGTINVSAGTLFLQGTMTLAGLGTLNRNGGTVNLSGTLDLVGGTLNLNAVTGSWNLVGGTVKNGTVTESNGALLVLTVSSGALTSVTVNGDLDLTQEQNANVVVFGGLVLNGTMYLGNSAGTTYGRVFFGNSGSAAGSLTGNATVVFGAWNLGGNYIRNDSNLAGAPGTLTIGSGVTMNGKNGSIYCNFGNGSLVNQGTINVATAAGTFIVGGNGTSAFSNQQGTINVSAGTLFLQGTMTLAGLGTLNRNGGTVNFSGTLDLVGGTLNLNAVTGSWNLVGGTVKNGTVTESNGALLVLTVSSGALTSVTVNGDLDLTQEQNANVVVFGGLVLNGTMYLGNSAGTTYGRIYFGNSGSAAGSLTGNATVVFGAWNLGGNYIRNDSNLAGAPGTLTIGSGVTMNGKNGSIYCNFGNGSLVNQGTINVANAAGTFIVGGNGTSAFSNQQGTINVSAGTLFLQGTMTLAGLGTLNRNGGTVNLSGTLDLVGGTLNLNAVTGSWNLVGGTVKNGTVTESNGALLVLTVSSGALTSVTVNGDLDLTQEQNANVVVFGGLVLNGTMYLGNSAGTTYGRVFFGNSGSAAGSLTGNATVVFGAWNLGGNYIRNDSNLAGAPGTLTIGSGVTMNGKNGSIYCNFGNGSLVNQGTINVATAAGTFIVGGNGTSAFSNQQGTINVSAGTLFLQGTMTLAGLGTLNRNGGTVNLSGTLDLVGGTLNLNAVTGSWNLVGGTVKNGTVTESNGALLVLTVSSGALTSVTVNGDLDLTQEQNANVVVFGGLVLNGTMYLGNSAGTTYGRVFFGNSGSAAGSLTGNATVVFGAWNLGGNYIRNDSNLAGAPGTLTIGSGVTMNGKNGSIYCNFGNGSLVNQGTINVATAAGTFIVGGNGTSAFSNQQGTINVSAGTLFLQGTMTLAGLGTLNRNGGTVNLSGTLDLVGGTLNLNAVTGSWNLVGGTVKNGTVTESNGALLVLTVSSGALTSVTVNGDLDLTQEQNANVVVFGGLVLNGTMYLGNSAGTTYGRVFFGNSGSAAGSLTGNATVVFGAWNLGGNYIRNDSNLAGAPGTLTIGSGVTMNGKNGSIYCNFGNGSLVNQGTINVATAAGTFIVGGNGTSAFSNTGTISAQNGATLLVPVALTISGQAILTESASSVMRFNGNLLATTTTTPQFNLLGTVTLGGTGTSSAPQLLEVLSQELGGSSSAFLRNYTYGTLGLTNNTYVKLVDQSDNAPGSSAEAVYTNALIVPTGTTLDLNGLKLYARAAQINGTLLHPETLTLIPDSGPLILATPTPGAISPAGQLDEWTVFLRKDRWVTVSVNPGTTGSPAPVAPQLHWVQVQLLDSSNNVLASASNATDGVTVTLPPVSLSSDGIYKIRINAPAGHTGSTGNYVVTAWDSTPSVQTLNVNEITTGSLATPFSVGRWTFAAAAGTQVQFNLLAASASGLTFSLDGPNGYSGFANIASSSPLITLPTAGAYTLTALGANGATGTFTFTLAQTSVTPLTLGTLHNGSFAGTGQPQLFSVDVPSAGPLSFKLTDSATTDHIELYVRFGSAPTRQTFDYAANGTGASQSLLVPSAPVGTWFVLVYAESVASAPSSFTLQADTSPVRVTAVTPARYGTNALATLTLDGAGFTTTTSVALVAADNTIYPASNVTFDTFTQLSATVNLAGVPQGIYSIRVMNASGGTSTLAGAFTVTAAGQAHLETKLVLPDALGRRVPATLYVRYANTGAVAMPAPVLLLQSAVPTDRPLLAIARTNTSPISGFWTSAFPQGYANTVQILASGRVPGVLGPGESITVPVSYVGMQDQSGSSTQFNFELRIYATTDADPVNWSSLQAALQPVGLSSAAWARIYANLTSLLGNTWGSFVQLLDNQAAYLAHLGETVTDVDRLWSLAVQQANNSPSPVGPALASATDDAVAMPGSLSLSFSRTFTSSISGRFTSGPLGFGWSTPWQTTATAAADGTVTVLGAGDTRRVFQPDRRSAGVFFSRPGDTGILRSDGLGGYLLTESDGTATDFNPDGTLKYVQDTNGNRITAGYTGGRLTSLTASSGQSIGIGYNAAGRIITVTDSLGRVTAYAYDATNQHLLQVTAYNGQVTGYTYNTTAGSPALHALTSIVFPGGTHQFFSYDALGRLSGISNDGGAQPLSFAYNLGQVSITDASGATAHLYYNEQGLVVKRVDPLGNVTLRTYDGNFNLIKVTNALGQSQTYAYDAVGLITAATDYLGNTTQFVFSGPFHRLASMTDAKGNTTRYTYDTAGNLLTTTYANGAAQSFSYNPSGTAKSFLNANGQSIQYTYNAAGQIVTETFPGGSQFTYTYDSKGNLLTATDATGTTTFTYDPTTGLLTHVAYPNATFLTFTYNGAGRRTQLVDQTGFTVNYVYDGVGRLAALTDAGHLPIVIYTYDDPGGRLSRKTNGNGTVTTYEYDAAGNLLHLVNFAPGNVVTSRSDYTYNPLGLVATEATLDGTWTNTYDAAGRLIHAVFASTNSSVPDQDLAYAYDAVGNRVMTVRNGVTTAYTTNSVNQYTSIGGVTHTYDAAGNLLFDGTNSFAYNALNQLTQVIGSSGTTSYTYNALGQRVASTTNGQLTNNLIDAAGLGLVVGVLNAAGTVLANYAFGLGLVSQVTPGGANYYNFDGTGSTVELTGPSGQQLNSYRYLPFGSSLSVSGTTLNPFTYAGESGVMSSRAGAFDLPFGTYNPSTARSAFSLPVGAFGVSVAAPVFAVSTALGELAKRESGMAGSGGLGAIELGRVDQWLNDHSATVQSWRLGLFDGIHGPVVPNGPAGAAGATGTAWPMDPNAMVGPNGSGPQNFVPDTGVLPYQVQFENIPMASGPAQAVTINNDISPDLDWSTFQILGIGWGDVVLAIPGGSQHFAATVPVIHNGQSFSVHVEAGIHTSTGQVYVNFQSLDPVTQLPPGVLTGFLPQETDPTTGRGTGYFRYTIRPRAGLATGTEIRSVALITFDQNDAIATDQLDLNDPSLGVDPSKQALVTIDSGIPTSSIAALPDVTTTTSFTLNWSGDDIPGGSGLAGFEVYVSDNGAPFTLLVPRSLATSTVFNGVFGHTYRFYSLAFDYAGNRQPIPSTPQAQTQLIDPRGTSITVVSDHPTGSVYGQAVAYTVTVAALLPGGSTPTGTVQFRVDGVNSGSPIVLVNGGASKTIPVLAAGTRSITAAYTSDSGTYDPNSSPAQSQVVTRATLTVAADNKAKVAGDPIPTLTWTFMGFVNGESSSVLTGSPSLSAPPAALNTAGTYTITAAAGSLAAANYSFQFVNGTLTVNAAAPASVTATAGTPQSAGIGAMFAVPFKVVVHDAFGNPVPGVTVTLTAPTSGPSGTFAGGATTTNVVTNTSGVATAPAFTANNVGGSYSVIATLGSLTPAVFALANTAPLGVQSIVINDGSVQRSMVTGIAVTFTDIVTLSAGAFEIRDAAGNLIPATVSWTTQVIGGRTVATLSFGGTEVIGGSLADGRYTLRVRADRVTGPGGAMTSDAVAEFFRLFGDGNGDGVVDADDLDAFGLSYGSALGGPDYLLWFDYNGDGVIDADDLDAFGLRYGSGI